MQPYILINTLAATPDNTRWGIIRTARNEVLARFEFTGTRDEAEAEVGRLNATARSFAEAAKVS